MATTYYCREVGTVHKTKVARRLQAFDDAIQKNFVKIGAYYVGPGAERAIGFGLPANGSPAVSS